jgi:deoxycytidine triphosphate deaminase
MILSDRELRAAIIRGALRITPEMPICQLVFETVDGTPEKGYEGRFSIQGPTGPPST